jgi:hypothetical protein
MNKEVNHYGRAVYLCIEYCSRTPVMEDLSEFAVLRERGMK